MRCRVLGSQAASTSLRRRTGLVDDRRDFLRRGRGRRSTAAIRAAGETGSAVEGRCSTAELKERMRSWTWRQRRINFLVVGKGPPVLLVHGFGASILHFRKNIPILAQSYTVYALDLLGFGGSEKAVVDYSMELWRDLLLDFVSEWISEPFLVIGNSIGGLASIMATIEIQERVKGVVLLNTAGAMNNKGLKDDWRIAVSQPLFWILSLMLWIRPIAQYLFEKFATAANVRAVLENVYCNKEAVDDELVDIFLKPSTEEGALDVLVSILTGPGGPRPQNVLEQISCPLLVLWGEEDFMTPFSDNPVSGFLKTFPRATFISLPSHALHDDRPDLVHQHLLPWLAQTYPSYIGVSACLNKHRQTD